MRAYPAYFSSSESTRNFRGAQEPLTPAYFSRWFL